MGFLDFLVDAADLIGMDIEEKLWDTGLNLLDKLTGSTSKDDEPEEDN